MKKLLMIALAGLSLSVAGAAMAEGNPAAGKSKAQSCAACHGADGNSMSPDFPKLAGQHEEYLYKQLKQYKSGERENAIMAGQVAGLSDQDMQDLAAYYASQAITPGTADETKVELGKAIYRGGNTASGVPACMACHGPNGAGIPAAKFPALAGQHAKYIAAQLYAFREGARNNDAGAMMRNAAAKMTDAEIEAVAEYIAGLR